MSQATQQLAGKDFYHQLTEKQKGVIDAYAERPESTHTAIQRIANARLKDDGLSVTRSYVPVVLEKYGKIAEERRKKEQNERPVGEEKTIGEPHIPDSDSEVEITVALSPEEIQTMMDDELPESIRMKMLRPFMK